MKKHLIALLLLCATSAFSQINLELLPNGFPSVTINRPPVPEDKLIEAVRNWVATYNERNQYGYDITDVSSAGMTIDAHKRNAFYYRNRGELYQHRIRYTMRLEFGETIKIQFSVKEIYAQKRLVTLTVQDFFLPDGRLKDDYRDAKPSLEKTANGILNHFADFMARVSE